MKRPGSSNFLDPSQKLLVLIGPSGSGKSKLVQALIADSTIELTPSWTTRPRRTNDEDAPDHAFVTDQEFQKLKQEGFFLETAQLFGMPFMYGLPRVTHTDADAIPTIVLRSMVLPFVHRHYKSVVIYQVESPKPLAEKRITARGGTKTDITNRLEIYEKELQTGREAAHRIFINDTNFQDLVRSVRRDLKQDFQKPQSM